MSPRFHFFTGQTSRSAPCFHSFAPTTIILCGLKKRNLISKKEKVFNGAPAKRVVLLAANTFPAVSAASLLF